MSIFQGKGRLPVKDYTDEDAESLLSNSENVQPLTKPRKFSWRFTLGLVASHLATALIVGWIVSNWKLNLDQLCAARTSYYSPVLKDVTVKYSTTTYNGSFFHETIYRQDPSPEVDQAWKDLGVDCMYIPSRGPSNMSRSGSENTRGRN
jgi:hypothetical protein